MLVNFLPLHSRLLALVGLAVLLASCSKPVSTPPPLKPDTFEAIFTFADPAEASQWKSNYPNLMKFAPVEMPGGGHGVKLSYDPKYNWPSYMLDRPKTGEESAPPVKRFFELFDSGDYDAVAFTLRNDSDAERVMAVNDMTPFKVPAKTTKRFDVAISQLVQRYGQKPQDVARFAITGIPDQDAFEVTLEDVGFLKKADNAEALRAGVAARADAFARKQGGDRFAIGVESPMRHVFPEAERYEPRFETTCAMKAARNESESFQAVVVPFDGPLEEITWEISDPANPAGDKLQTSVRVVGYVEAGPVLYALNATGGWYPDLLLDAKSVPCLEPGTNLALWVKTHVPESAEPGLYKGSLTVRAKNAKSQTVEFSVEGRPFTLPQTPSLKQAYRINVLGPEMGLAKIYPPEKVDELLRRAEQLVLGEYKLDANVYTRPSPPWNWDAKRLRELKAMGITGICLGYFDKKPTEEEFARRIEDIEKYLAVVDEAGVRDMVYFYGFDEIPSARLPELFETAGRLKQHFPKIPFLTTATAYEYNKGSIAPGAEVVDGWCAIDYALADRQGQAINRQALAKGRGTWWYVCNQSAAPCANVNLEQQPAEPRILLGALSYKYGVDGFLYYALNSWGNNALPADTSRIPFVDWNPNGITMPETYNGEAILFAAGKDGLIPTIRMEMMRDGLEDYEYYTLAGKKTGLTRGTPGAVPKKIADHPRVHTTDPEALEAERERLAQEILKP